MKVFKLNLQSKITPILIIDAGNANKTRVFIIKWSWISRQCLGSIFNLSIEFTTVNF